MAVDGLADESGTEGSLLGTVHWLGLDLGAALASVLVIRTRVHRRRGRA